MAKGNKGAPVEEIKANTYEFPDMTDWVTEKLGDFPPYWKPEEGKAFYGRPIGLDYRDPEFPRVVWEAMAPTDCYRGPVDDAEEVQVIPGESFTTSEYSSLARTIELMIGLPFILTATEKVKVANDATKQFWKFEAKMSPETAMQLKTRRVEHAKAMKAARNEDKQLHQGVPVS